MSRYELLSTLSISGLRQEDSAELEAKLRAGFSKVGQDYPALVAYFVKAQPDSEELKVGVRFDGIAEKYAEDVASEILDSALLAAFGDEGSDRPVDIDSSLLTPA